SEPLQGGQVRFRVRLGELIVLANKENTSIRYPPRRRHDRIECTLSFPHASSLGRRAAMQGQLATPMELHRFEPLEKSEGGVERLAFVIARLAGCPLLPMTYSSVL